MRRFTFITLCVVLLAACGAPNQADPNATAPSAAATAPALANTNDPCGNAALQSYRTKYNTIIGSWSSAVLAAGQTKPADLQAPIDSLQKIADELNAVDPPACAQQAHSASVAAMKQSVMGYQNVMAKKEVGSALRDAIDNLANARTLIAALPGTPAPLPTLPPTNTPAPTWTPEPTTVPTNTPMPTATPAPRNGRMAGRTQMYESATSPNPIKTLAKDTAVLVFEVVKGRIHIQVDGVDGWVSQSTVIIK